MDVHILNLATPIDEDERWKLLLLNYTRKYAIFILLEKRENIYAMIRANANDNDLHFYRMSDGQNEDTNLNG